ncbi:MAG: restriction endonuclease subunit S [Nitrosomonadales bacterium]|nr:restriction endonuclease subunit S [Nitrosomonadales bacterium]
MKAGWEVKKLGEVCTVIAGQSPEGKFYNNAGDGLPFYQGKKEFTEKYIGKPTTWTTYVTKEAEKDDVLMSVRAPVGPVNFSTEKICIGRGLAAIRSSKIIDKNFLFNFLLKHEAEIVGNSGAVFDSVNKKQIESILIPVPPIHEQERIVAILDQAFVGIAKARANAEQNLRNARTLFESHLQNIFSQGDEFVALSELATDITDGDHMPPPKTTNGIPFITISNVNKQTRLIDFSDTFTVDHDYYNNLKPNRKPQKGDVLYTVTGSYGIPVIVDFELEFCFQRHIGLIRPNRNTNSQWLYYLLLSPSVFQQASDGATGTAQKTVSLKVLRNIKVPQMSSTKQQEIVRTLDALAKETQRLETLYQHKITLLDELKKSLLQQAFAGEL